MNRRSFLRLIGILFLIIEVNSIAANDNDSLKVGNEVSIQNGFLNRAYIKMTSLGFAGNEIASEKRLRIKNSVKVIDTYIAPPVDISTPLQNAAGLVAHAKSIFNKVTTNRLFVTALHGKNISLPVGITKSIGGKDYSIVIDSIVITPTYAYGVIYTILPDTQTGDSLVFGAKVTMSKDGGFASNGGSLFLLSNKTLNFGENNSIEFIGTNNKTFVEFDCNGFNRLSAQILVTLMKGKIVQDKDSTKNLTIETTIQLQNFDNWIIEFADIPAFQFTDYKGYVFDAGYMAFDHHSSVNPTGFVFPKGYILDSDPNTWEGFCIERLTVTLPKELRKRDSELGITISVENSIIDRMGYTGTVSGTDIIALNEGDMNGWDFSLKKITLKIVKNQFVKLDFNGEIIVPVAEEEKPFAYTALIQSGGKYFFTVANREDISFPLWGASKVELYADSKIEVRIENHKFIPEAVLSGKMNITASINKENENLKESGTSLSLAEINFQQLHISSNAPFIFLDPANGAFTVGSPLFEQKLAKLPVTISDVGLVQGERNGKFLTGVKFTVRINLTGNKDAGNGFGANATAIIFGEKPEKVWKFYKCELERAELENVNVGPLAMSGFVEFYRDDPAYGTGFSGAISLGIELKDDGKIGVKVAAIFGKILDINNEIDYRYWAVDALANFPAVPLYPGLIYANAFGGGASYRMEIAPEPSVSLLYHTNSGIGYIPGRDIGLSLRAMLGIQGQEAKVYNGEVAFEIAFDAEDASVEFVRFSGFVEIASIGQLIPIDINKVKEVAEKVKNKIPLHDKLPDVDVAAAFDLRPTKPAIMAQWLMVMDFEEKIFTATADVFVNAGVVAGSGENRNAGHLDVIFSPDAWHIYLGEPNSPMGLKISGPVQIATTAYLVMGSIIPAPNKPTGFTGTWAFSSDVQAGSVKGFGFGTRLTMQSARDGAFFYSINIGAGFDILLRNVEGKVCAETGEAFGFKNWYATGMAFMYVDANAGLKVCIKVPYLKCNNWWQSKCWDLKDVCTDTKFHANFSAGVTANAPNPTNMSMNINLLGKTVALNVGNACTF